ncbi:MAG TPA: hypothetical protein VFO10_04980 [Oligoflexus sp.]|uniref:hypothetical protein n=1 Tax=Oligoflexus sp. TaxID=1971216 RepID=UPI002D7F4687|nr:hypothetical protein [Oligoflexus sp.]HET9236578.1 hypothetical protein [Oligoflexus sp.]
MEEKGAVIKTLIESFRMGQTMKSLESWDGGWKLIHEGVDGTQQVLMVDEVISSAAAQQLRYLWAGMLLVWDDEYARHVDTLRTAIAPSYPSLHLVGRNGMHKYNNQGHADDDRNALCREYCTRSNAL